ncbi:MAG TPA: glycosyl hydrolase family 59, partial [Oscillospiraceae bacterium]|nr:glycosyl hydrolase family 59 [Oscillospiraceae bacterium]
MNELTNIVINGENANTLETMLFRGAGMVSGNNSSRLLLDYKAENPDAYWEIMNYIFGEKGIGITFLKLEMGSDVNSSSGTEPSVKRTQDERADVTRGAGYQLAADAKTINPDLSLDMLWWSEPVWVAEADDVYEARYKWYKETLDAAFETYAIKFDYVSTTQNERAYDENWIIYLSKTLKSEIDCPYDYSKIKIVAGDEVCTWIIADKMLGNEELLSAIDVIGSHYTSRSTEAAQSLAYEYGKELWFSEGSTSMSYAQGTYRFDEGGSGLDGLNGALDIANRNIMMYPNGRMTMCQYQPVVSAYYDGVTYCQKQFILASDPWSGYYMLDNGFFISLHFSQFMKKGWAFVDGASYADAKNGGDGHGLADSVYSYVTSTDTETGDYSTVITNTTSEPIAYNFTVSNLAKASSAVEVWETRGPDGGRYDENYFKKTDTITPISKGDTYTYSVVVKPSSIVTVSTIKLEETDYSNPNDSERTILSLPYTDDFEYFNYDENYLSSRGNAPRYTTDQGGAFEVRNIDGNNVVMQMITPELKAKEWGWTPDPTTNFGDDRWFNYSVSVDVTFAKSDNADSNYTGVGLR